jgi:hypothetical protein
VTPGTLVELPLYTGLSDTERIAYLSVMWETNYDPAQMRLQLVQIDNGRLLWQQDESGELSHSELMAWDASSGNLMFRVVAVPEPSTLMCLLAMVSAVGLKRLERRIR